MQCFWRTVRGVARATLAVDTTAWGILLLSARVNLCIPK